MKNKVLIIYTGGTIGMKPSEKGLVPEKGYLDKKILEILEYELSKVEMPTVEVKEFSPLIDSSDVDMPALNRIANMIYEAKDRFSGFVVLHGTDTMAYTASALSFLLSDLGKPVVVTGSQIPFSQFRSDGRNNLLNTIYIANNLHVNEVCLFFNDKLLRGSRVTKFLTDGFDAFVSLNSEPLAEVGVEIRVRKNYSKPPCFSVQERFELVRKNIEILHLYPGYNFDNLDFYSGMNLDALIIQGFGVGNVPTYPAFQDKIRQMLLTGVKVVLRSQCPVGKMAIKTYEGGLSIHNMGVLSCGDMTIEATLMKLNFLLSMELSNDDFIALWERDLVGELS